MVLVNKIPRVDKRFDDFVFLVLKQVKCVLYNERRPAPIAHRSDGASGRWRLLNGNPLTATGCSHTLFLCDTLASNLKELTPDMVTSASHLEIPLMTAERAWAYGMQRKQETADAPYRVRRHVATRLAKAAKVRLEEKQTYLSVHRELGGLAGRIKNLT